jgi:hypothetical protein
MRCGIAVAYQLYVVMAAEQAIIHANQDGSSRDFPESNVLVAAWRIQE